jgi:hypothetical protein
VSFAVGTYGLDNAATVDYGAAHAKGSRFQFRYSAGMGNANSASAFKLCKTGEISTIIASGTDFVANSEWSTNRVTAGASAGKADGGADLLFWQSRGLARGASIYVSWDAAPSSALYDRGAAYLSAYNAALGGYYVCDGLYAGIPALNEMADRGLIKHGWIPEASSWSVPNSPIAANYAPPAKTLRDLWQPTPSQYAPAIAMLAPMLHPSLVSAIWQTGNHWPNGSDENVILRSGPIGSHLEANGVVPSGGGTPVSAPTDASVGNDVWVGYRIPAGSPWAGQVMRDVILGYASTTGPQITQILTQLTAIQGALTSEQAAILAAIANVGTPDVDEAALATQLAASLNASLPASVIAALKAAL